MGAGEFTYAEYARRGFFELVAVAALVLPLLLCAHWLVRRTVATPAHLSRIAAASSRCFRHHGHRCREDDRLSKGLTAS